MKKALQIAVLVLAPIALAYGVYSMFFSGPGSDIPNSVKLVDLETGKIQSYSRNSIRSIPLLNEQTKRYSIYPVAKNEAGQWYIEERYRDGIKELAEQTPLKVDLETFLIVE